MRLGRRSPEEPQINLTSLIDVVFLLLIFFMVTTTFVRQSGLEIRLPEAGTQAQTAAPETLEIVIDAAGEIYVQREIVKVEDGSLREALQRQAEGDFAQPLRIRADGRAAHASVVGVMDVAAKLGFTQVDIATRRVQEPVN